VPKLQAGRGDRRRSFTPVRCIRLYRAARLSRQRRPTTSHDLELEQASSWCADDGVSDRHSAERHPPIPAEIAAGSAARPSSISSRWRRCWRRNPAGRQDVMTREEVMRATADVGSKSTVKIGAKKDGTIVAAQALLPAGRALRLADRGAVGCSFSPTTSARAVGRLRRGLQPLQGRGLSRARRADRRYAVECVSTSSLKP